MSKSNKKRQEFCLSVNETAEKLRIFADKLERGVAAINEEEYSLAIETPVEISLKAKDGRLFFKLKFSLATPFLKKEEPLSVKGIEEKETWYKTSAETGTEKYKDLKKRMSKDFKAIKKSCLETQTIPEISLVERFCHDSKTMCTYPNKGDEFYQTYLIQVDFLCQAFKNSDLEAMSSAITALDRKRKECHDKYQ